MVSLLELKRPFEFKIIAVRNVYEGGQRKLGNGEALTSSGTSLFCEVSPLDFHTHRPPRQQMNYPLNISS